MVNGDLRSSVLDHIYTNIKHYTKEIIDSNISDHMAISINIFTPNNPEMKSSKLILRDWSRYSREKYSDELNFSMNRFTPMSIDEHEDFLSLDLMIALNKIAPEKKTMTSKTGIDYSPKVKSLKKKKSNMLKKVRRNDDFGLMKEARALDKQIQKTMTNEGINKIRNVLRTGSQKDFWKSVNLAQNKPTNCLPQTVSNEGTNANSNIEKAQLFMDFFLSKTNIQRNIGNAYDGKTLLNPVADPIFTEERLDRAIKEIKPKHSYGYNRIPMRALLDSYQKSKPIILSLFKKIEQSGEVPTKWKISRIIPIFKKGDRSQAQNYRPISNLCSIAKLMERIILLHMLDQAYQSNVDLTGPSQFGFKKNSNTATLSLLLQQKIAKCLERNELVGMASLDLTAAFDSNHLLNYTQLAYWKKAIC